MRKHGHCVGEHSATYYCWARMIQRCTNPKHTRYKEYGGRGIQICDRWMSFSNFLADMGTKPDGKSLDRFPNNDGNYEPGNVRWATVKEQQNNRRSVRIEHGGVTLTIAEWAHRSGVPYPRLWARIKLGWSMAEALQ